MFRRRFPEFRLGVTRIEDGDTLVVETDRLVPRETYLRLQQQLQAQFDDKIKVIVLERGLHARAVLSHAVTD